MTILSKADDKRLKSRARLTAQQQAFCEAYLRGKTKTEAARVAGYSRTNALVVARTLLSKPHIKAYLASRRRRLQEITDLDAKGVVERALHVYEACVQPLPVFDKAGRKVGAKIDSSGALGALSLLARYVGLDEVVKLKTLSTSEVKLVLNLDTDAKPDSKPLTEADTIPMQALARDEADSITAVPLLSPVREEREEPKFDKRPMLPPLCDLSKPVDSDFSDIIKTIRPDARKQAIERVCSALGDFGQPKAFKREVRQVDGEFKAALVPESPPKLEDIPLCERI